MRSRINRLVLATTSTIVVSFVVPLCLLVRTLAEDRAMAAADQEARNVAIIVAGLDSPRQLTDIIGVLDDGVSPSTSGLTAEEFVQIDQAALAAGVGVVASGNFALTAALMTRFSIMAAEYLDWFEIIDYSRPKKTDAPTGTARELAERMGDVKRPSYEVDPATVRGEPGLRGGTINGVQVHSLRMPSYSATVTSTFANGNSRLTITHDADTHSADILVPGTLLAARRVMEMTVLTRGLDRLL